MNLQQLFELPIAKPFRRLIRPLIALLALHLSACGGELVAFFTVGGSVSGLVGPGLVLQINGRGDLPVSANGAFNFTVIFTSGVSYVVTVKSQPSDSSCVVTNASGTIGSANILDVMVRCSPSPGFVYTIAAPSYQISGYSIQSGSGTLTPLGSPVAAGTRPQNLIAAPSGSELYVSDVESDTVTVYSVDAATGALSPLGTPVVTGPPGSEPVNMVIAPSGRFLYVNNAVGNVVTFSVDPASGSLTAVGTPLSVGADMVVKFAMTPDGKFLYMLSGFGTSPAITVYTVNATTGALTAGTGQSVPAGSLSVGIDPLGRFLFLVAAQSTAEATSASVIPYTIDPSSGELTVSGAAATINSNGDAIVIEPTGHTAYVLDTFNLTPADNHVDVLDIDPSSGVLTALGSPVQLPCQASSLVIDTSGQYLVVGGSGATAASSSWYDALTFSISKDSASLGELTAAGLGTEYPLGMYGVGLVGVLE